jgi:pSer/pThr/pTyr-binding forkhead associated (FHA) protein
VPHRYGAASAEEIPLLGDSLIIGRFDPESGPVDIDLENTPEAPQISRHHAEMYREAGGTWYVKDLGSTNGVFIKRAGSRTFDPRITAPEAVSNGDEISFGNARFILRVD